MKIQFKRRTPAALLLHAIAAAGVLALFSIFYFYVFLPRITHQGESVVTPDLEGIRQDDLDDFLAQYHLRYEVGDSSYSETAEPLTVLQQFPKAGFRVKENRKILVTINQTTPPRIAMPDIVDQSRINGEAVLRSNRLKVGEIILEASPFLNLIKGTLYKGQPIKAGDPVPRGAIIDLLVGDGEGRTVFNIESLVGASYEQALAKLEEWNLHVGSVEVPEGTDTTAAFPVVYKQSPDIGETVHIGDPVDIWLAPANDVYDTLVRE